MTISVLIADDHNVVRDGLRFLLSHEDDIDVVAEAADGRETLRLIGSLHPDVVLLDLYMPGLDGHAVLDSLRGMERPPAAVVLTSASDDEHLVRAVRQGATAYLMKTASADQVVATIRDAASGTARLSAAVLTRLTMALHRPAAPDPLGPLSPRERQVLALLARAMSNRQIACELGVGEQTVKTHVSNILAKLGVADRMQAAIIAIRLEGEPGS